MKLNNYDTYQIVIEIKDKYLLKNVDNSSDTFDHVSVLTDRRETTKHFFKWKTITGGIVGILACSEPSTCASCFRLHIVATKPHQRLSPHLTNHPIKRRRTSNHVWNLRFCNYDATKSIIEFLYRWKFCCKKSQRSSLKRNGTAGQNSGTNSAT